MCCWPALTSPDPSPRSTPSRRPVPPIQLPLSPSRRRVVVALARPSRRRLRLKRNENVSIIIMASGEFARSVYLDGIDPRWLAVAALVRSMRARRSRTGKGRGKVGKKGGSARKRKVGRRPRCPNDDDASLPSSFKLSFSFLKSNHVGFFLRSCSATVVHLLFSIRKLINRWVVHL